MSIEGHLEIELYRNGPLVERAVIASSRSPGIARLFIGKTVQDVTQTVPLVFSICAMAQSFAATTACERALGLSDFKDVHVARQVIVLLEMAREHALRIALDWPGFLDERRAPAPGMQVKTLMKLPGQAGGALFDSGKAFAIGSRPVLRVKVIRKLGLQLYQLLEEQVFDEAPDAWKKRRDVDELRSWAGQANTVAAHLVQMVLDQNWAALGAAEAHFLPVVPDREMSGHIEQFSRDEFTSLALWKGRPCETGPLSRQKGQPLIKEILRTHGPGLLARLVARLCELATIPGQLSEALDDFPEPDALKTTRHDQARYGLAQVEAARGRLVHRVLVKNGRVDDYRILAPTEWNFHPEGPAAGALTKLKTANSDDLKAQAGLLINSIDPCVGFEVRLH
jgi:coenzyme F420-reducing hydrogenase alpha subunit